MFHVCFSIRVGDSDSSPQRDHHPKGKAAAAAAAASVKSAPQVDLLDLDFGGSTQLQSFQVQ
jgi:hypothetical protein